MTGGSSNVLHPAQSNALSTLFGVLKMEAENFRIVNNIVLDKNILHNPAILTRVISVYSILTSQLEGLMCLALSGANRIFFLPPKLCCPPLATRQRSLISIVVRLKAGNLAIE